MKILVLFVFLALQHNSVLSAETWQEFLNNLVSSISRQVTGDQQNQNGMNTYTSNQIQQGQYGGGQGQNQNTRPNYGRYNNLNPMNPRPAPFSGGRGQNTPGTGGSDSVPPRYNYIMQNATFASNGVRISGRLFTPQGIAGRLPAITILGPITFVKEQPPFQYATRLASMGYVTLIYDPRNHGESDGEPRRYESPKLKIEDVGASIDYLQSLPQIDPSKIFAVGICQGASEILEVAVKDSRIRAIGTVTGNYVDRDNLIRMVGGLGQYQQRIARGDAAKRRYELTGRVEERDYVPVVDEHRKDVVLPAREPWLYYHGWVPGSNWENRYTIMSDAEIMRWDASLAAGNLTTPWVMVHADYSDGPETARRFFQLAPSQQKQMEWMGQTNHIQFYENPYVIDQAANKVYWFFQRFNN